MPDRAPHFDFIQSVSAHIVEGGLMAIKEGAFPEYVTGITHGLALMLCGVSSETASSVIHKLTQLYALENESFEKFRAKKDAAERAQLDRAQELAENLIKRASAKGE